MEHHQVGAIFLFPNKWVIVSTELSTRHCNGSLLIWTQFWKKKVFLFWKLAYARRYEHYGRSKMGFSFFWVWLDCEWKAQAGNPCVASFDWTCSGICRSVDRMPDVHHRCGEGEDAVWSAMF